MLESVVLLLKTAVLARVSRGLSEESNHQPNTATNPTNEKD